MSDKYEGRNSRRPTFQNGGEFIKRLLTLETHRIFGSLHFDPINNGDICVFEDENAKYTLLRSPNVLHNVKIPGSQPFD